METPDIEIRPALSTDLYKIKDLMLTALEEDPTAFSVYYDEYSKNAEYWWLNYLHPYFQPKDGKMFLATEKDKLVAMIGCLLNSRQRSRHVATMVWFYVLKDYRNKGLGTLLVNKILDYCKQIEIMKVGLIVSSNQKDAIKLYEKFGFKCTGTQEKELFINGEYYDCFLMEKFI